MGRRKVEIDKNLLRDLCEAGLTEAEIAKRLNCSRKVVTRRKREYGIIYGRGHAPSNIRANHDPDMRGNDPLGKREADFASKVELCGFRYVSGYRTVHSTVRITCGTCGGAFNCGADNFRPSKNGVNGPFCHKRELNERAIARAEETARRRRARAVEISKEITCKECGKAFHSEFPSAVYCSDECRKRAKNKAATRRRKTRIKEGRASQSRHRERARHYGVEFEPGITIAKLIERDGNACALCGCATDKNDREWGTLGPRYPTIDHIVPMSAGGGHTWKNVQVACALCNSKKRDLTNEAEIREALA